MKNGSRSEEEQTIEGMLKMLTKLDVDSVSTSEKLLNLHVLLMHLLASNNELEGVGTLDYSEESFEKALTYDLLCCVLESELKEVDKILDELEVQIVDISKLSAYKHVSSIFFMVDRLGEAAKYLKQCRGRVSWITVQLAQLQRTVDYIINDTSIDLYGCV